MSVTKFEIIRTGEYFLYDNSNNGLYMDTGTPLSKPFVAPPEWDQLSDEDRNLILNINNDEQFTDLAIIFAYPEYNMQIQNLGTGNQPIANKVDLGAAVHDCIGVALGIYGIKSLFTGIFTVEKGISLLRILGRRYLSYIGIAWMIWDFTDCISDFL